MSHFDSILVIKYLEGFNQYLRNLFFHFDWIYDRFFSAMSREISKLLQIFLKHFETAKITSYDSCICSGIEQKICHLQGF